MSEYEPRPEFLSILLYYFLESEQEEVLEKEYLEFKNSLTFKQLSHHILIMEKVTHQHWSGTTS